MAADQPPVGERRTAVEFTIVWAEYDNDDLADDDDPTPDPDTGWYAHVELPDESCHNIGPDEFGPGFASLDGALAACRSWAEQRGFTFSMPSSVECGAVKIMENLNGFGPREAAVSGGDRPS